MNFILLKRTLREAGAALVRLLLQPFTDFARGTDPSAPPGATHRAARAMRIVLLIVAALALIFAVGPHLVLWVPDLAVGTRLASGWPLFTIMFCAVGIPLLGAIRHRRSGRSFFFPGSVALCVLAIALAAEWIIGWWAVDWLFLSATAWVLVLALVAAALAFALVVGAELWRMLANALVCHAVRRAVLTGAFQDRGLAVSPWGSPHALRVVQGVWDCELHAMIATLCGAGSARVRTSHFRHAAEALALCLRQRWPDEFWAPSEAARRLAALHRHRLTLAGFHHSLAADGEYAAWLAEYSESARAEARASGSNVPNELAAALLPVFRWARASPPPDVRSLIRSSHQLFTQLPQEARETFANTWLAVVPCAGGGALGPHDIVCQWERFAAALGRDDLFPPDPTRASAGAAASYAQRSLPCDPAPALASRRLADLYSQWRIQQPASVSEDFLRREEASAGWARVVIARIAGRLAPGDLGSIEMDGVGVRRRVAACQAWLAARAAWLRGWRMHVRSFIAWSTNRRARTATFRRWRASFRLWLSAARVRLTRFFLWLANFRERIEDLGAWFARLREQRLGGAILAAAGDDASCVSSWIYREVWLVSRVRWFFAIFAAALFFLTAGTLSLLCPRVPGNGIFGWNRVDHVEDRRFGSALISLGQPTVLGRSHTDLAIGTKAGLYMMNERSRAFYGRQLEGEIRDLAEDHSGEGLLALRSDGDLTDVRKAAIGFSTEAWLPRPAFPVWPGAARSKVLAAGFGGNRCILALQGVGIGAYVLRPGLGWHGEWQTGDYGKAGIEAAWISRDRVYAQVASRIICVNREDGRRQPAFEFGQRQRLAGAIAHFEFGNADPWASLVEKNTDENSEQDGDGPLWLQPASGGWTGPFFGGHSEIKNADEIVFARLADSHAWLATSDALHLYDLDHRSLRTVLRAGLIVGVEPIAHTESALVATARGLHLVNATTGAIERLESRPVRELSLSADGKLCVYRVEEQNGGEAVYARTQPFANPAAVLLPAKAWRTTPSGAAPEITGVVAENEKLIVTTLTGGFLYDSLRHTYADGSSLLSIFHNQANETNPVLRVAKEFGATVPGRDVITIADGHPCVFRERMGKRTNVWLDLDPYGQTIRDGESLNAVTAAGEFFFGASPKGYLHSYPSNGFGQGGIHSFCTGRIPALDQTPGPRTFIGDLSPQPGSPGSPGSPLLGFIASSRVVTYDTNTGTLKDVTPPDVLPARVRQLLVEPGKHLLLLDDQRVALRPPEPSSLDTKIFGSGALPFNPRGISAVGDAGLDQCVIAGPQGAVMSYGWTQADWAPIGGGPCPLAAGDSITEVRRVGDITFLNTRQGRPCLSTRGPNEHWQAPGGSRVVALQSRADFPDFILLTPTGPFKVAPSRSADDVNQWPRTALSSGAGIRDFVERADALWGRSADSIVFLDGGGNAGSYSLADDSWSVVPLPGLSGGGVRYASSSDRLFALAGSRLRCFGQDLKPVFSTDLDLAPGGVIAQSGGMVRVAAANSSGRGLALWNGSAAGSGGIFRRRGDSAPPPDFDPAEVVLARLGKGDVFLVDARGSMARYTPATGVWTALRSSSPGEILREWLVESGGIEFRLSKGEAAATEIVTFKDGRLQTARDIPAPFDRIGAHFTQIAAEQRAIAQAASAEIAEAEKEKKLAEAGAARLGARIKAYLDLVNALRPAPQRRLSPEAREEIESTQVYVRSMQTELVGFHHRQNVLDDGIRRARARSDSAGAQADGADRERAHFELPVERPASKATLLAERGVSIERSAGRTQYQFTTAAGEPFELHPLGSGFVEDAPAGFVLDQAGALLTTTPARLLRFAEADVLGKPGLAPLPALEQSGIRALEQTNDGRIRVRFGANDEGFLGDEAGRLTIQKAGDHPPVAELSFGSQTLRWFARTEGGFEARWSPIEGAATPARVWSSRDGKFAWASVQDVALLGSDQLVFATEAGFVARNSRNNKFVALHPYSINARDGNPPNVRLLNAPFTWRPLALLGAVAWRLDEKTGAPSVTTPVDFVGSVQKGPWIWSSTVAFGAPQALSIQLASSPNVNRQWRGRPDGGWRFADDCVNWLLRIESPRSVWLATEAGLWPFNAGFGLAGRAPGEPKLPESAIRRAASFPNEPVRWLGATGQWRTLPAGPGDAPAPVAPPGVEGAFQHSALRVNWRAGQLICTPLDDAGGPLFRDGTFFFDAQSGLASADDVLWTVVPGRCVIGRDPKNVSNVIACIPLPRAPNPAALAIVATPDGPCLRDPARGEERWWFQKNPKGAVWSLRPPHSNQPGSIGWRTVSGRQDRWEPVVFAEDGSAAPIKDWWAGDRFAWDKAQSVAALDERHAVVVSRAGPWVGPIGATCPIEQFWARPDATHAAPARRQGESFGVALRTTADSTLVVEPSADGRASLSVQTDVPLEASRLRWERVIPAPGAEIPFAHFDFVERWEAQSWNATPGPAIESGIAGLPSPALIRQGSFVFDRAAGACPLAAAGHWLAWRTDGGVSPLAHDALVDLAGSTRTRFLLVDEWSEPSPVLALHSIDAGRRVCALRGSPDAPSFASASGSVEHPELEADASARIEGEFQIGDQVSLDVSTFSWCDTPLYAWSAPDALAHPFRAQHPALQGYQPFQDTARGLGFVFDDWRSIATRETPGGHEVAIGTAAGVWIGPLTPNPVATFSHSEGRFFCALSASPVGVLAPLRRVRFAPTEGWIGTTDSGARMLLSSAGANPSRLWKPAPAPKSPNRVSIVPGGLLVEQVLRTTSSDAWLLHRRSLENSVDVIRGERADEYWVATGERDGLFKVTIP